MYHILYIIWPHPVRRAEASDQSSAPNGVPTSAAPKNELSAATRRPQGTKKRLYRSPTPCTTYCICFGPTRYAERKLATSRARPMAFPLPPHQRTNWLRPLAGRAGPMALPLPQHQRTNRTWSHPVRRADHSDQSSGPRGCSHNRRTEERIVRGDSPQKMTLGDSVNNRQGSFPFCFSI